MRTNFLDYYKLILDKVSFERNLFRKEYRKAMKNLMDSEQDELNQWLRERGSYPKILFGEEFEREAMQSPITDQVHSSIKS